MKAPPEPTTDRERLARACGIGQWREGGWLAPANAILLLDLLVSSGNLWPRDMMEYGQLLWWFRHATGQENLSVQQPMTKFLPAFVAESI